MTPAVSSTPFSARPHGRCHPIDDCLAVGGPGHRSLWTPAHADADARRVMSKRFLRDLWTAWRSG
jgi:hypothetical protein